MTRPITHDDILLSPEYRAHRRALQRRFFRTKPRANEAHALNTAALLAVRAQRAAVDPQCSYDQLCKVVSASRRALHTLQEIATNRTTVASVPLPGAAQLRVKLHTFRPVKAAVS
jgi:hypothetical protein